MTVKLTRADVREIKRLLSVGIAQYRLAARYGVSRQSISNIWCGNTYQDVPWPHGKTSSDAQNRQSTAISGGSTSMTHKNSEAFEGILTCSYAEFTRYCAAWYDDWDEFEEWRQAR